MRLLSKCTTHTKEVCVKLPLPTSARAPVPVTGKKKTLNG